MATVKYRRMITALPAELQFHIVSHLSTIGDFTRFGSVCKAWRTMQQSEHFWKIVVQKFGIPLPQHVDPRSWVVEHYQLPNRIFRMMSQPDPTDFQELISGPVLRHFRSLAQQQQDTLKAFFHTFHEVFQATPGKNLRKEMIQDLFGQNLQPIFRVCRHAIFFNFCDNDVLQLYGPLGVRIRDLNAQECLHLRACLEQNRPIYQALYQILNRRLQPLEKRLVALNTPWVVQKPFDPKTHSIDFTLPYGLYLATLPVDFTLSLSDLEGELALKPHLFFKIRPYQRLIIVDIPDETGSFLNGVLHSSSPDKWYQICDLVNSCFVRHRLRLDLQGGIVINYDHLNGTLTLCSDDQIEISKLPVESEC